MAAVATRQQHMFRWGELADDAGDLGLLLPPRIVLGPEYRFDGEGSKVKVTTNTRGRSLARTRLSRSVVERRAWTMFGDAVKGDDAGSRLTMVSTEEVLLERPLAPGCGSCRSGPSLCYKVSFLDLLTGSLAGVPDEKSLGRRHALLRKSA